MKHIALALLLLTTSAAAKDPSLWSPDPQIRKWFQNLTVPDNPPMSCCGLADAYEADLFEVEGDHYVAIITDGRNVIPNGTRVTVPNAKIKWDQGNPTGHGIIFIGTSGQVYCYAPPTSG